MPVVVRLIGKEWKPVSAIVDITIAPYTTAFGNKGDMVMSMQQNAENEMTLLSCKQ
jgi:hypothetical protein